MELWDRHFQFHVLKIKIKLKMNIIGINAFHADSSACLIINGKLISAVEEERFNRIKHWAGFPVASIKYCLKEANFDLNDIDHICINIDPKAKNQSKAQTTHIFLHFLGSRERNVFP